MFNFIGSRRLFALKSAVYNLNDVSAMKRPGAWDFVKVAVVPSTTGKNKIRTSYCRPVEFNLRVDQL